MSNIFYECLIGYLIVVGLITVVICFFVSHRDKKLKHIMAVYGDIHPGMTKAEILKIINDNGYRVSEYRNGTYTLSWRYIIPGYSIGSHGSYSHYRGETITVKLLFSSDDILLEKKM